MLDRLKSRASALKIELHALALAYRDPRVPWSARLVAALVVVYAFSPIDLIPDPIPIVGYLDDLILVPAGIALALRLIPAEVMADCRAQVRAKVPDGRSVSWAGAALVVMIWIALVGLAMWLIVR